MPADSVAWLTTPLRRFGDRLGTVLFRVPDGVVRERRAAGRAARGVAGRPAAGPRVPGSELARRRGVRGGPGRPAPRSSRPISTTDAEPPTIRRTGPFLYLRLRRAGLHARTSSRRWLDRLEPFLADGVDAFVYFRHDEVGRGAELALELAALGDAAGFGARRRRSRRARDASAGRARPLGRPERDEQGQVLGDVVEAVRDGRRDEHDRARPGRRGPRRRR